MCSVGCVAFQIRKDGEIVYGSIEYFFFEDQEILLLPPASVHIQTRAGQITSHTEVSLS